MKATRKILAIVLALMLALSSMAVFADEEVTGGEPAVEPAAAPQEIELMAGDPDSGVPMTVANEPQPTGSAPEPDPPTESHEHKFEKATPTGDTLEKVKDQLKDATCIAKGVAYVECECGAWKLVETDMIPHSMATSYQVDVVTVQPDCTKPGKITWTAPEGKEACTICHQRVVEIEIPAKTEHHYDPTKDIKDKLEKETCTTPEYKYYECSDCHQIIKVETPNSKLNHKYKGGKLTLKLTTLPATDAGDCKTDGVEGQGYYCTQCNTYFKKEDAKKLFEDNKETYVEPDVKYLHWDHEQYIFSTFFNGIDVVKAQDGTVTATSDDFATAATYPLLKSGTHTVSEFTNYKDHYDIVHYGDITYTYTPASCKTADPDVEASGTPGSFVWECTKCGAKGTITIKDKKGMTHQGVNLEGDHSYVDANGTKTEQKAADCTRGYYEVWQCTVCKKYWNRQTQAAQGHDYSVPVKYLQKQAYDEKEPQDFGTDFSRVCPGLDYTVVKQCSRCTSTVTEVVKGTGKHDYNNPVTFNQPATCEDYGYTIELCNICQTPRTVDTVAPLGHYWDTEKADAYDRIAKAKVTKDVSCEADGEMVITCGGCSATKTVTVPKLGHDFQEKEITPGDCYKKSTLQLVCTHCGKTSGEKYEGTYYHAPKYLTNTKRNYVPASHTHDESYYEACKNCGEQNVHVVVTGSMKKHIEEFEKTKDPTYKKTTAVATCTTGEVYHYECPCGWKSEEKTGAARGHVYKAGAANFYVDVNNFPTCEHTGTATYSCYDCKKLTNIELPKLPHNPQPKFDSKTGKFDMVCSPMTIADYQKIVANIKSTTTKDLLTDYVNFLMNNGKYTNMPGIGCKAPADDSSFVLKPKYDISVNGKTITITIKDQKKMERLQSAYVRVAFNYEQSDGETMTVVVPYEMTRVQSDNDGLIVAKNAVSFLDMLTPPGATRVGMMIIVTDNEAAASSYEMSDALSQDYGWKTFA